jgi:hypothetical protein
MEPLFELGRIVATPGALDAMQYAEVFPTETDRSATTFLLPEEY